MAVDFNFGVVGNDAIITWALESLVGDHIVPCDLTEANDLVVKLGYGNVANVEIDSELVSILPSDSSVLKVRIPGNHTAFQKAGWVNAEVTFTKDVDGVTQYFKANRSKCMQYYNTSEQVEALIAEGAEFNGEIVKFKNSITLGNYEINLTSLTATIEEGSNVLDLSANTAEGLSNSDAKVPTSLAVKNELAKLDSKFSGVTLTTSAWESKTATEKSTILDANEFVYITED